MSRNRFPGDFHPSPPYQLVSIFSFSIQILVAWNSFSYSSRDIIGCYIFWSLHFQKLLMSFTWKKVWLCKTIIAVTEHLFSIEVLNCFIKSFEFIAMFALLWGSIFLESIYQTLAFPIPFFYFLVNLLYRSHAYFLLIITHYWEFLETIGTVNWTFSEASVSRVYMCVVCVQKNTGETERQTHRLVQPVYLPSNYRDAYDKVFHNP